MTPGPERVGSGIVSLEAEMSFSVIKSEIDSIIKNALKKVDTGYKVILSGMIAEREILPTGVVEEYFHPAITIEDKAISAYNEGGYDEVVLGGANFEKLFHLNYHPKSVDWGGEVGDREYKPAPYEDSNPFCDFFEGKEDAMFLDLVELKQNLQKYKLENEVRAIDKGELADFLLPRTVDTQTKLELARRILIGLKNAGGIKEENK